MLLLLGLCLAGCSAQADPPPPVPETTRFAFVSDDPVKQGERIAKVLGCTGCHGADLAGKDWSDEFGTLWTANLTRSVASHSDAEFAAMIRTGSRADRALIGMPSHIFTQLDDRDLAAVIAYIRSKPPTGEVHPTPSFTAEAEKFIAEGKLPTAAEEVAKHGEEMPPDLGREHDLGRYIVRATCAECHGLQLRGAASELPGDKGSPDLRMVGAYDPADFVTLMRTGKAAGNREIGLMSEVARGRFANLTDAEVEAVRGYLVELAKRDP
jgi:mono/diheme cytochrome c family protein